MKYQKRIYDDLLAFRLSSKACVLIEGPKWCGKTTTATQQASSALYLQNPDTRDRDLLLAETNPSRLLEGTVPRLIDEWQDAPVLWDAMRFEADKRAAFGQFVLTGSVVPPSLDKIKHSGTGRVARLKMRTMSLFEMKDSNGGVSLKQLFQGATMPIVDCESDIEKIER